MKPMSPTNRLWHPFSDMTVVAGQELVLERGEGVWVWDTKGRRYLDATAGLWFCNVGHGRAELAEAGAFQMRRLAAYSTFGDLANEPALALAAVLAVRAPIRDGVVFFTSGGSEAIETAAKIVRRYWAVVGQPSRQVVVVREGAYHGMAGFGTSFAGIEANAAGWGDLLPGVVKVPRDDAPALARVFEENRGRVAAFLGEPVQGAGGIHPPPDGYWAAAQSLCRTHDVLLIADEVVTGFGRVGRWFGSERYGLEPDLVVGAKGITSGYMPLGYVVCGPRVAEPFWKGSAGLFRHGYTYSGHAAACAVGLANLRLLEDERLVERTRDLEPVFAQTLGGLAGHPAVSEVRTAGLLCAIEIVPSLVDEPGFGERILAAGRRHGVLTRLLLGRSLQVSPPLVIGRPEIETLVAALRETLDEVSGRAAVADPQRSRHA
jgi:putrescine aminotransferase